MRYSTEQIFTYRYGHEDVLLTVKTNGGTLIISTFDSVEFVIDTTITEDGASAVFVSGAGVKYTPTGGCTFSVKGE